jgi:hypothetical protein
MGVVKRHSKNKLLHHLTPRTTRPLYHGIRQSYPKWVSRLPWGLPKLRVQRQNPPVGSEPPKATKERDEATQAVASSWCIRSPNKGTQHPQASYLRLDRVVFFMPLRVGWHQALQVFPLGISQERCLKSYGLDLTEGGGHWLLSIPMERHLPWLALTHEW